MLRGLAAAAAGMSIQTQQLDIIAENLANVDTPGYQRQLLTANAFVAQLNTTLGNIVATPVAAPVRPETLALSTALSYDTSEGGQRTTGNHLDFALPGNAYFAVRLPDGSEAATRNGAFTLDDQHQLVTVATTTNSSATPANPAHGLVLGQHGPITLNNSKWEITRQGAVVVNGVTVDQIKIMAYSKAFPAAAPVQLGNGFVTVANTLPARDAAVTQGMLSGSNVNPITEMISMIAATRLFEANQKCIQAQDETLNQAVNNIAHS